jgi:KaiC/GvpD/RAD55 family RecA-like ATPase
MSASIRWVDLEALMAEPPPPVPWVVEPLLARGAVTMLAGPAGVGKSLLALALTAAVASNAPTLAGMDVTGGRVVVIDAENGERVLRQRAHLAALPPANVRVGLPEAFDLRKPHAVTELSDALDGAALLVLDSLASLAPGLRENEADHAGPVLDRLRRLAQAADVAVLLLHHARKDGDTYRGGTSLPAAVDILAVYCRERGDTDPERRLLTWTPERGGKMRLAAEPAPRWLRVAIRDGRLTIDATDPPDPDDLATTPAPTRRDVLRDQLVAVLHDADQPMRQGDLLRSIGLDSGDRTGRRALHDATEHGHLTRLPDGHYTAGVAGTLPPLPATPRAGGRVAGWHPPTGGVPTAATPATPNGATDHDIERAEAIANRNSDLQLTDGGEKA